MIRDLPCIGSIATGNHGRSAEGLIGSIPKSKLIARNDPKMKWAIRRKAIDLRSEVREALTGSNILRRRRRPIAGICSPLEPGSGRFAAWIYPAIELCAEAGQLR